MLRSICIVERDYPALDLSSAADPAVRVAEGGVDCPALAQGFARAGVAVHVIAREPHGRRVRTIENGTTVWRVDAPRTIAALSADPSTAWLAVAAELYLELDALVHFDVVYLPEAMTAADAPFGIGPHTALVSGALNASSSADLAAQMASLSEAERRPRFPASLREPAILRPKLGVVMVTEDPAPLSQRGPRSVLQHTTLPLRLVLVDPVPRAEIPAARAASSSGDERVRFAAPAARHAVGEQDNTAAARNLGIDALDGDETFVVFLDADVELTANWWAPFVAAFEADPDLGLAGEAGALLRYGEGGREVRQRIECGEADIVGGGCMMLRRETISRVGRFDTELGAIACDDDYALRAQRIGEHVRAIGGGTVLPARLPEPGLAVTAGFAVPGVVSPRDDAILARRARAHRAGTNAPVLVLADAREILENPRLLASYGAAFTAADDVALVLFGPGLDPAQFASDIATRAATVGFDLEEGPRLIALLPQSAGPGDAAALGDEAYALLSDAPPPRPFAHLAAIRVGEVAALRLLAAHAWRARGAHHSHPILARQPCGPPHERRDAAPSGAVAREQE